MENNINSCVSDFVIQLSIIIVDIFEIAFDIRLNVRHGNKHQGT